MRFQVVVALILCWLDVAGQGSKTLKDTITIYFEKVMAATKENQELWGKDLYGPILFVNPFTRRVYANYADSAGVLKADGSIFTGKLPSKIVVSMTSINWGGRDWAMIMEVPALWKIDSLDILSLLGHELFHRSQPVLGFLRHNDPTNAHLDKKDGRIYLRLELLALLKATSASSVSEMRKCVKDALIFRKYRYSLFPGAQASENALELSEGITEYTGYVISGRNKSQAIAHFEEQTNKFILNPTYVRTFAYNTVPVYGFLLRNTIKYWNKQITAETNLTNYFIKEFKISIPSDLKRAISEISEKYNAKEIIAQESAREEKTKRQILDYKNTFTQRPHFEIFFRKKNLSFDPGNLVPIEGIGTVYPTMQANDVWGTLIVTKGALINQEGDKVTISSPVKTSGLEISGDGWTLQLNEGYTLLKDENTGNYSLTKK